MKNEISFRNIHSVLKKRLSDCAISLLFLTALIIPGYSFGNFAYVANNGDDTVSVIDTDTNLVVAIIPLIFSFGPYGVAITVDKNFAYVTGQASDAVFVIDTTTNTVVVGAGLPITVGDGPERIAMTPDGQFAYVTNFNSTFVSVINTTTKSVATTVTVGANRRGIAITPNGSFAYVTHPGGSSVSVIDTSSNMVVGPLIPIGGNPQEIAIGSTVNGVFAYVSNAPQNVSVINTATNMVIATPAVGMDPRGIALTPNGRFAYVTNFGSDNVSVIDTSTNTAVATITIGIGMNPEAVAITSDGRFAYVVNSGSNSVSVIDTSTNMVITGLGFPIAVGDTPYGIAIIPSLQSPQNLQGHQKINDFGVIFERYNLLQWEASLSAVAGYYMYRDGVKIATLEAAKLKYEDHNRKKGVTSLYSVTSFDAYGNESAPLNVEVK